MPYLEQLQRCAALPGHCQETPTKGFWTWFVFEADEHYIVHQQLRGLFNSPPRILVLNLNT